MSVDGPQNDRACGLRARLAAGWLPTSLLTASLTVGTGPPLSGEASGTSQRAQGLSGTFLARLSSTCLPPYLEAREVFSSQGLEGSRTEQASRRVG